ncbi:zinc-regulated protein 8-like [Gossypium australe]|uniref:Zinc-regulated protein 8-like n=1 Tax=Gossypium australe TaxID=47621 RepID=A0A5B6V624_9ROSI|nr:zinc-regulated protein 8-like [Gossypium australe]
MDTKNPIIENTTTNHIIKGANQNLDHDHHPSINSRSSAFLLHNGLSSSQFSDVEMMTSYTSLKELLPASSPTIISPTMSTVHNSSWNEIPIKNPLVKQAALAYLQPMESLPPAGEKGFFERVKENCSSECGCVSWMFDVVLKNAKMVFWPIREVSASADYVDDNYYDDKEKWFNF